MNLIATVISLLLVISNIHLSYSIEISNIIDSHKIVTNNFNANFKGTYTRFFSATLAPFEKYKENLEYGIYGESTSLNDLQKWYDEFGISPNTCDIDYTYIWYNGLGRKIIVTPPLKLTPNGQYTEIIKNDIDYLTIKHSEKTSKMRDNNFGYRQFHVTHFDPLLLIFPLHLVQDSSNLTINQSNNDVIVLSWENPNVNHHVNNFVIYIDSDTGKTIRTVLSHKTSNPNLNFQNPYLYIWTATFEDHADIDGIYVPMKINLTLRVQNTNITFQEISSIAQNTNSEVPDWLLTSSNNFDYASFEEIDDLPKYSQYELSINTIEVGKSNIDLNQFWPTVPNAYNYEDKRSIHDHLRTKKSQGINLTNDEMNTLSGNVPYTFPKR